MRRLLLLALALAFFTAPTLAQNQAPRTWTGKKATAVERTSPRPPEQIPLRQLRGYGQYAADDDLGTPTDTLSEAQILRRISRAYQLQADLLAAQADGELEHAEGLLEIAMTEIAILAQQPGITERPRFRELYRTIVTEYERYYGVQDTVLAMPFGDIFQLRADMFALLEDVEQPLLEDVTLPPLPPMETVFPMTVNRAVESTLNYFVREKRELLLRWKARADTYHPMIEQIFREEGVPDELKYLAFVESGLNPRAQSWAKAVGMWQFIAATGGSYGLEVNTWVDERMDPEKATRAAARHLRDLYEMYNHDWQVAIAGYNCSPRCIKRAIRQAGGTDTYQPSYWDLYPYLPRETRGYVPQFIAFALIFSNPDAFGLTDAPQGPRYEYHQVPVKGMLSLEDVAKMAGTEVATIRALNPELRRSTLPPTRGDYLLRLPLGTYERFAAAFENLPKTARQPVGEYVVRRGDTLNKIAARHGVSLADLKQTNGLRGNTIHAGQRLVVPVPDYSGEIALGTAPPVTVQYGTRTVRPIEPLDPVRLAGTNGGSAASDPPVVRASDTGTRAAPRTAEAPAPRETRVVYRVRRGDTLGKIAGKYGVSVRDIQQWNNLRGTTIKSGQRLTLYASGKAPSQPERIVYKVRRGDNLSTIAGKYGVSVKSIRSWNNLRSNTIRVGQRLTIHPGQSAPRYTVYKVRRGDNLTEIARRYGTSVSKVKQWNNLTRNTIYPGQRLKVYR